MTYKLSASYERMKGFYRLPKNTLDIVFLGTSHIYYDIIPMQLWNDYGITSYALGQETQRIECLYFYIKEVLKYQSPKLIVLDVWNMIMESDKPTIKAMRKSIDYMKWGTNKLEMIKELVKDEDMYEYFNHYLNHDTSKYIETSYEEIYNNNEFVSGDIYSIFMLEKFKRFQCSYAMLKSPQNIRTHTDIKLKNERKLWQQKAIKEIRDKNIDVLCINTPCLLKPIQWGVLEELEHFLKDMDIRFLECNTNNNSANINLETDFWDKGHLNYLGAKKLTQYIGKYIMDNYQIEFEDKRNNPKYKVWNDYNIKYQQTNERIMQNLLTQNIFIREHSSINGEFEESFNRYVENNIDIKLFYSKIKRNNGDINMELVKLKDEKDYVLKLHYKLGTEDYVLISRALLDEKMYNWSNKKGIEIEIIPDNSNRDFVFQILSNDGYRRKRIRLDGYDSKHIKILFEELENPKNDGTEFDYTYLDFFQMGVSTQWSGEAGDGSVIIKFIKLF